VSRAVEVPAVALDEVDRPDEPDVKLKMDVRRDGSGGEP